MHITDTADVPLTDDEIRRRTVLSIIYVALWYATSLTLSIYNKWLFSRDHMDFSYPLFVTTFHMVVQFCLSGLCVLFLFPSMRPNRFPSPKDYLMKVVPCGIATGLDIGLSNSSLKVISLSFYTMVKSGAPVFVLLFAFLFRLEKPTWRLTGIISVIVLGTLLMVGTETKFNLQGYLEVQTATVLSGFRWSITQILLARASLGMSNPFATSLFLAPIMAASLLIASMSAEDLHSMSRSPLMQGGVLEVVGVLAFGGVLAFCMVMSEFQLISVSSVVAFSVAGVLKEVLTIFVSLAVFRDGEFTLLKWVGLFLSLGGICVYNWQRMESVKEERLARRRGGGQEGEAGLLEQPSGGLWIEDDEDEGDHAVAAIYGYQPLVLVGKPARTQRSSMELQPMG